jgi:hypothetical protein
MPYVEMDEVAPLDPVTSEQFNNMKTNVDIRTGLYSLHYIVPSSFTTNSTSYVTMSGLSLAIPSIEEQNLLFTFSGRGTSGGVSRYRILAPSDSLDEHYLNPAGRSLPIVLNGVMLNTTGGVTVNIQWASDTGSQISVLAGSVLSIIGF